MSWLRSSVFDPSSHSPCPPFPFFFPSSPLLFLLLPHLHQALEVHGLVPPGQTRHVRLCQWATIPLFDHGAHPPGEKGTSRNSAYFSSKRLSSYYTPSLSLPLPSHVLTQTLKCSTRKPPPDSRAGEFRLPLILLLDPPHASSHWA